MADLFDRILLLKESNIFAKVATDCSSAAS